MSRSLRNSWYVFVRGLGERYSNTTLSGSAPPTTEPTRRSFHSILFPTALIDSVQVSKSYSPDKSAPPPEGSCRFFKLPSQPVVELSATESASFLSSRARTFLSAHSGSRDGWGYDNGSLGPFPLGIPETKNRAFGHLHTRRWFREPMTSRRSKDVRERLGGRSTKIC